MTPNHLVNCFRQYGSTGTAAGRLYLSQRHTPTRTRTSTPFLNENFRATTSLGEDPTPSSRNLDSQTARRIVSAAARRTSPNLPTTSSPTVSAGVMISTWIKPLPVIKDAADLLNTLVRRNTWETRRPDGERERCLGAKLQPPSRLGLQELSEVACRQWITVDHHSPIRRASSKRPGWKHSSRRKW